MPTDVPCQRCESLDFARAIRQLVDKRIFNNPEVYLNASALNPAFVTQVGRLSDDLKSSPCPLCRLFDAVRASGDHVEDPDDYVLRWKKLGTRHLPRGRVLHLVPSHYRHLYGEWEDNTPHASPKLYISFTEAPPVERVRQHRYRCARRVIPDRVDFSLLRDWLVYCDRKHRESSMDRPVACSSHDNRGYTPLKLIDCKARSVVSFLTDEPYVALSYVWGRASRYDVESVTQCHLPQSLPQTIHDAITVVLNLGFRYLWVDRYCIDQSDENETFSQVQQMDQIYKHAYMTLIAAAGSDPFHGLPGVTKTFRQPSKYARIGEYELATIYQVSAAVERAVWNSRAWTYQEVFFSRRRLVFTDYQVYFECCGMSAEEQLREVDVTPGYMFPRAMKTDDAWVDLSRYSRRTLSHAKDAIRAFTGILNHYQQHVQPTFHLQGVLLVPHAWCLPTEIRGKVGMLAYGLTWKNNKPGARRASFPSWSWAGWECAVIHPHEPNIRVKSPSIRLAISLECRPGNIMPFEKISLPLQAQYANCQVIHVEAFMFPVKVMWSGSALGGSLFDGTVGVVDDGETALEITFTDMLSTSEVKQLEAVAGEQDHVAIMMSDLEGTDFQSMLQKSVMIFRNRGDGTYQRAGMAVIEDTHVRMYHVESLRKIPRYSRRGWHIPSGKVGSIRLA